VRIVMARLNYNDFSILEDAWKLIGRGETVEIVLTGCQAKVIGRAFPHYLDSLAPERGGFQRRLSLIKLIFFGAFCAPTLWAICNRAIQVRMPLSGSVSKEEFVVKCQSIMS
jgi:hypothetical protein